MPSRLVTKKLNFSVVSGAVLPAPPLPAAGAGAVEPAVAVALVPATPLLPVRPAVVVGAGLLLPAAGVGGAVRPPVAGGVTGAVVPAALVPGGGVTAFEPAPPGELVVPAFPVALLVFAGSDPQPN